MDTSIEKRKGRALAVRAMGTSIEKRKDRALAVFDKPGNVIPHLTTAKQIKRAGFPISVPGFPHSRAMAPVASRHRDDWLPHFDAAYEAHRALTELVFDEQHRVAKVERNQAIDMLSALLGAFAAKGDRDVMLGMLDMLETGDLVAAIKKDNLANGENPKADAKVWRPLFVCPTALALACRKLIATATFPPRAAELAEACFEVNETLGSALSECANLMQFVQRCDALLLEFEPEQWRQPYLTPRYRSTVQRLFEHHGRHGNGDDEFEASDPDDEDDAENEKPNNRDFRLALKRALQQFPATEEAMLADDTKLPTLRRNDCGSHVWRLQRLLGIAADGQFGYDTKSHVREFQAAHGLAATGDVGPATWQALEPARLGPAVEQKKIAACTTKLLTKRTRKPKRKPKGEEARSISPAAPGEDSHE